MEATIVDQEIVQTTETDTKAGDEDEFSATLFRSDGVADGGPPYCFRLKNGHPLGALGAVQAYTPWWKDLKTSWPATRRDLQVRFKNWTLERAAKSTDKPTHVAMNQGNLRIPLGAQEDSFLEAYTKCLLAGHRMYFVERLEYDWTPPCCRLFMDLDFKQLLPVSERGIEGAAVVCTVVVHRFFPGKQSRCIVASTTHKNASLTTADGIKHTLVKTGVHLYWPEFFVTPLQCLHIRESIIAELTNVFHVRNEPAFNEWSDVVDASVYSKASGKGGSGLRMLGSCKTEACSACKGRGTDKTTGAKCSTCDGFRRVNDTDAAGRVGRPYMMLCVLGHVKAAPGTILGYNAERDLEAEKRYMGPGGMLELIRDTKIRTALTEDTLNCGFQLPPGAPLYVSEAPAAVRRQQTGAPARGEKAIDLSQRGLFDIIQTAIREGFGGLYASVVVRNATLGSRGKVYRVNVTGTNCRYCQNIGREHSSNNIYFLVSKEGIRQRCYDNGPKTAEMKFAACKDYASGLVPISASAMAYLWPETAEAHSVMTGARRQDPVGLVDALTEAPDPRGSAEYRRLMNGIEFLCKSLYDSSFAASAGLQILGGREGPKVYMPQNGRNLGSRGLDGYLDLGLSWAEALEKHCMSGQDDQDETEASDKARAKHNRPSFKALKHELLTALDTIVAVAAHETDLSRLDGIEVLDDVIAATSRSSQLGRGADSDSDSDSTGAGDKRRRDDDDLVVV